MLAVSLVALLPTQALAHDDDDNAPGIYGTIYLEYQSDHLTSSSDSGDGSHTYASHALDLEVRFNHRVSFYSTIIYEPIEFLIDYDFVDDDRFFEKQALYLEEAYLQFNLGHDISVFGGKFSPNFGIAWDYAAGIYGADVAEEYELTDYVGFGAVIERDDTSIGDLELTVSAFMLDRSELSNSLFHEFGANERADGGAGNTDGIESFLIALDVEDLFGKEDLGMHLSYLHRGAGIDGVSDENGFAIGFYGERELRDDLSFEWIAEAVIIDNYEGTAFDADFFTAGISFEYKDRYNLSFVYSLADYDHPADGSDLQMFAVAAGVDDVWREWDVEVGYRYTDDDLWGEEDHIVGLLVSKEIEFGGSRGHASYK